MCDFSIVELKAQKANMEKFGGGGGGGEGYHKSYGTMAALAERQHPEFGSYCTSTEGDPQTRNTSITEQDVREEDATFVPDDDFDAELQRSMNNHSIVSNQSFNPKMIMTTSFFIPSGSPRSATFNLVSATVGPGIVVVPVAFREAGALFAALSIAVCSATTVYSVHLLLVAGVYSRVTSFEGMSHRFFGHRVGKMTEVFMVVFCIGDAVAYVATMCGALRALAAASWMEGFRHHVAGYGPPEIWLATVIFLCVMLPLSLLKKLDSLRLASFFGVVSMVYLVGMVIYHALSHENFHRNLWTYHELKWVNWDAKGLVAFPVVLFSFVCQPNIFDILAQLKFPTVTRMTRVTSAGMGWTGMAYFLAGTFAYCDFGHKLKDNVLENYPPNSILLAIGNVAVTASIALGFPLCIFPARDSILHSMGYHLDFEDEPSDALRMGLCACLATFAMVLGLAVPSVVVVFGLLGAVIGSLISLVLPAMFALKVKEHLPRYDIVGCYALVTLGFFSIVIGTWASLQSMHHVDL